MEDSIHCLVCNGSCMDIIWQAQCNLGAFYLSFHGSWCTVCCWLLKWLCKIWPWCVLPILEPVLSCRCEHRPCVGWQNLGWGSDVLGFSAGSASVSMAGDVGDCEHPPWDCTFLPLSSYGDKNHLRIRRCLISTLLRISKNNSHKKLILFLPIIGTNKLVFKLFSFSLCSNLGKFSNNFVCCLLYLGHWSNASTGMKY